ncbi:MAG: hypothetical protein RLZ47_308 [Bacteroidota bacterium]
MSKRDKLIKRLKSKPKDFTYNELKSLLSGLGYIESNSGSTSGSRVSFYNKEVDHLMKLHKPHPSNILKSYLVDYVIEELTKYEMI